MWDISLKLNIQSYVSYLNMSQGKYILNDKIKIVLCVFFFFHKIFMIINAFWASEYVLH